MADVDDITLAHMPKDQWLIALADQTRKIGRFRTLGSKHFATFVTGKDTLIVSFETMQGMRVLSDQGTPMWWDMCVSRGWANLTLVSDGDTWFREPVLWDYIDDLIDEGVFDAFQTVVFYGAGPCGYAASAYSVSAPGCQVLAIQPQATLSPRIAGWDDRFVEERRRDFASRFGFAPAMIDAAQKVHMIYDPLERLDAMHAALFHQRHVSHLPMRHMGATLQTDLINMGLLDDLMQCVIDGTLTAQRFAHLYRARRTYPPYLRRLLTALDAEERDQLAYWLTHNVSARMKAPRFNRRLADLSAKFGATTAAQ